MKKYNILFALMLAVSTLFAQVPCQFNYQALVRGADGQVVANGNVGLRLSLLQGSDSGPAVWTSTRTLTTNANGVLSAVVGDEETGLEGIDWSQGPYYLRSEVDPNGGSNYELVTVQQLLSVPYALRAATVESHTVPDPTEEMDAVNLRTLNAALERMQQRMDSIVAEIGGGGIDTSDWVDLGLPSGLLWASHNVGATSPEEYGDYFAWGETAPKSTYSWDTYAYGNDYNQLTKYCNNASYGLNGFTDNLTTLQSGDDAATVSLGDGARMPTKEEWQELYNHCERVWIAYNNTMGLKLTGPNGRTLFLPAAGYRWDDELGSAGSRGYYWSSSLDADYPISAWFFGFASSDQHMINDYRSNGSSVRAVRQN